MKRTIVTGPASPEEGEVAGGVCGRFHVVSIGINRYLHCPPLNSAVNDAREVARTLETLYGFAGARVLLDGEATRQGIIRALREVAREVQEEDSLVVFYAGHGYLDELTRAGNWIPVEASLQDASQWIANAEIRTLLRGAKARHVLLISDSCFSGDFFRRASPGADEITDDYVRMAFAKTSRQVLTSGGLEPVLDGGEDGHSVFTWFLLRQLREHAGPYLLPLDLFERIRGGVAANARQQPQLGILLDTNAEVGGEFVFFRQGGTAAVDDLIRQKREQMTLLERREQEAKAAAAVQQAELEAKAGELAALDARIHELRRRLESAEVGGGELEEVVAMVEERERQSQALERLRAEVEAAQREREEELERLRREAEQRREQEFAADCAKYLKIRQSTWSKPEEHAQAWRALCRRWLTPDQASLCFEVLERTPTGAAEERVVDSVRGVLAGETSLVAFRWYLDAAMEARARQLTKARRGGARPWWFYAAPAGLVVVLVALWAFLVPPRGVKGPVIVSEPDSRVVNEGEEARLAVEVQGRGTLRYRWYRRGAPLTDEGGRRGAGAAELRMRPVELGDAGEYWVVVEGGGGSVTSRVASLEVHARPVITRALADQHVEAGSTVVFAVEATGRLPFEYTWLKDGVVLSDGGRRSGTQSPQLVLRSVEGADGGEYRVQVRNGVGSAESRTARLHVAGEVRKVSVEAPRIQTSPISLRLEEGREAVFRVMAEGGEPLEYRWESGGHELEDDDRIQGTRTRELRILDVREADAGGYRARVANAGGQVWSAEATLECLTRPRVLRHPESLRVLVGGVGEFRVEASGTAPLAYQWFRDQQPVTEGERVVGSRGPVLRIREARLTDVGLYQVAVVNGQGQAESEPVLLRVGVEPPKRREVWTNSLGMVFRWVTNTTALMSVWETRVQDYQVFVRATGRAWPRPNFAQGPTHPAVMVSWQDARAFCEWLTGEERKNGSLSSHQEYRLPTDGEWSEAVELPRESGRKPKDRSEGIEDRFPYSPRALIWPPIQDVGNYAVSLGCDRAEYTAPVGTYPARGGGFFDLGGNVWEWCADPFDDDDEYRVLRGASWRDDEKARIQSSYRKTYTISRRDDSIGFRVVVVP